jgi:predicted alpha/beta superfamily hydrolase
VCRITFVFIFLFLTSNFFGQEHVDLVSTGKINRIQNFKSKFVSARNIDIWLPDGYSDSTKYAVLYMQDGQMLFDANSTWNKQAWDIDDVTAILLKDKKIKPFIVVGIWNDPKTRHKDYFPEKVFKKLSRLEKDSFTERLIRKGRTTHEFKAGSDKYLKFLIKELKPYIDKNYSVARDKKNTFIMGSSMGALLSIYALCEYPKVFGGATCLSTHWPGIFSLENNPIPDYTIDYLEKHLPNPVAHKIYFDCGDQTLDTLYPDIQKRVDSLMQKKGFTNKNWQTHYFTGENHSEEAWKKRLDLPLMFLFGR